MTGRTPLILDRHRDPRPAWRDFALCQGQDPAIWFPEKGDGHLDEAKAICAECPVAGPCLDYALATNQPDGCWGGKSTRERRRIRAKRGTQQRQHRSDCLCAVCRTLRKRAG